MLSPIGEPKEDLGASGVWNDCSRNGNGQELTGLRLSNREVMAGNDYENYTEIDVPPKLVSK